MPAARAGGRSRQVGSAPQARHPGRMAGEGGEPRGGSESVGEPEVPGPTSGRRSPGTWLHAPLRKLSVLLPPVPGSSCGASLGRLLKGHGESRPPPPPAPRGWGWAAAGGAEAGSRPVARGAGETAQSALDREPPDRTRCLRQRRGPRPKSQCGERRPSPLRSPAHRPGGSFAGTKRAPDMAFLE